MTTTRSGDLEARVTKLEAELATLIDHLANNNDRLFDLLKVLTERDSQSFAQDAFTRCVDGTCDDRPPGCKRHGRHRDDDRGDEHGRG